VCIYLIHCWGARIGVLLEPFNRFLTCYAPSVFASSILFFSCCVVIRALIRKERYWRVQRFFFLVLIVSFWVIARDVGLGVLFAKDLGCPQINGILRTDYRFSSCLFELLIHSKVQRKNNLSYNPNGRPFSISIQSRSFSLLYTK